MSSGQVRTPSLAPSDLPFTQRKCSPTALKQPPKLVFPAYSNVLVSKQSYVQVVDDKKTIVNNNIFCIMPPAPPGFVLPSHQMAHAVKSNSPNKKRKRSPDSKTPKAKRPRLESVDKAFQDWVVSLAGMEELNLSKKLSGTFANEELEKLNWNYTNVMYLAKNLPPSVYRLNFAFHSIPSVFWKNLIRPERIRCLDWSGVFNITNPAALKPLTGLRELSLSTVDEHLAQNLITPQLKSLCLNDIPNCDDASASKFLVTLKQVSNCDLEALELNNNKIVGSIFSLLVLLFPNLRSLEVSYQEISKNTMSGLYVSALLNLAKLKRLSLYDNQMDDDALEVLSKSQTIEDLDIGGNNCTERSILSLIKHISVLQKLNIEDTQVSFSVELRRAIALSKLCNINIRGCGSGQEQQDVVLECSSPSRLIVA